MDQIKFFKIVYITGILIFLLPFLTGCSSKVGTFQEQTHFDYPNSNIKPLGQVKSSVVKKSFIVAPKLTAKDVRTLIDRALSQKADADLVINYQVDTTITSIPIPILTFYQTEMILSGTAVDMEVGRQDLRESLDAFSY